jgi:hypothetical protein
MNTGKFVVKKRPGMIDTVIIVDNADKNYLPP